MTLPNLTNRNSLAAQIKDAEYQILNRQRQIETRADTLVQNARRDMTAPSTMVLAGCIGFILGELTRCQTNTSPDTGEDRQPKQTTPLSSVLGIMSSVHTLYTALPIAWMIKSWYQPTASDRAAEDKVAAKAHSHDSDAIANRQTQ